MTETVGKSEDFPQALRNHWQDIVHSMWRLQYILTFDDWICVVRHVAGTLGVMNLIVGVMCETAVSIVDHEERKRFTDSLHHMEKGLKRLEEIMGDKPVKGGREKEISWEKLNS